MLRIPQQIIDEIIHHANKGLPEEVCGYLAGFDGEVTNSIPMTNIDHSPDHFSFDPAEQFKVVREARNAGLEILANYHSHPETPARPSVEDIRLAYDPSISYVIVSLAERVPVVKSFRIEKGKVENEIIEITEFFKHYTPGSLILNTIKNQ
jgi:[CysO sulfur-carrier protein]-S-L-cysteine hydrolase